MCLIPVTLSGVPVQAAVVTLVFSIGQQQSVYEQSIFGEPPQFAIWLEDYETEEIQTVTVTKRTATGIFKGRAAVPVALPAWIGAFRAETGRNDFPSPRNPLNNVDSIATPTPKDAEFEVSIEVPKGSHWYYYVEVNVSGDYTQDFPAFLPDGSPDRYGNGQPSIIYKGEIRAKPGNHSIPQLIGRTEQMFFLTEIIPDLSGIDSARDLFSSIRVICKSGSK